MIVELFKRRYGCLPEVLGYAPGRIEIIGNHTDYNGGSVLGAALNYGIDVALVRSSDDNFHFVSEAVESEVVVSRNSLVPLVGDFAWANYPLGIVKIMMEEGLPVSEGVNFYATSSIPLGTGLSSSAALELSTAYAILKLNGLELDRKKIIHLCRRAENEFVGMPCGILDQGVSAFGRTDCLVHIDCFAETFSNVSMPKECRFWVVNSQKMHKLVESKYSERYQECQNAFKILKRGQPEAKCLAQIPPLLVRKRRNKLGEVLYKRALHVTEETRRVETAMDALKMGDLCALGKLLTDSHRSSRDLFENSSPELDFLVDSLTDFPGVYGARLIGGGFGGSVMALTDDNFNHSVEIEKLAALYSKEFGIDLTHFDSRPGSGAKAVRL